MITLVISYWLDFDFKTLRCVEMYIMGNDIDSLSHQPTCILPGDFLIKEMNSTNGDLIQYNNKKVK